MTLRALIAAGLLAAGLFGTADKASAQIGFNLSFGNPYAGGFYPGYNPYALGYGNPYGYGFANPYGYGGYGLPTYQYRYNYYNTPFGAGYSGYRYQSPSIYGPGGYQYGYRYFR